MKNQNTLKALIDAEWECDFTGYSYSEVHLDGEILVELLDSIFDNSKYTEKDNRNGEVVSGNVNGTLTTIDVVYKRGFFRVSNPELRDHVMDVMNSILEKYKIDENVARDNDMPESAVAIKAGGDCIRILDRYIDNTIFNIRTHADVSGSYVYMGGEESVYVVEGTESEEVYESIKKAAAIGEVDGESDEFEDCLEKLDLVGYPPSHIYWWSEDPHFMNTAKRFYICFDCDSQV